MKTCICQNETCPQNGVDEFFAGTPDLVFCGVCQTPCELSEEYPDPEQPEMGNS